MSVFSQITRLFPPPRYMTLPSAGVDISDVSLKYVQFDRGSKRLHLKKWGDLEIPDKTVRRGDLINKKALVDVLLEVKKRCGVDYIRVSLPEERAYLFETSIKKGTDAKDIRSMLEFRLEENVPLSPKDAFFDYNIVDAPSGEDIQVSVAVYARDTILGYYEACVEARLVPLSFEVEAQAIARAAVKAGSDDTQMIVDFGKTRTGVGIVHKGSLMFTSTIDIGGMHLSEVLKRQINVSDESKLTQIKNEQGLLRSSEGMAIYTALLSPIKTLRDELEMRINYWKTKDADTKEERTVDKIIFCGGSSNLAGMPEYFAEELGVPTERAQVWQNAFSLTEYVPPITKRYSYGYATAIGLALTDFV